MHKNPAVMYAVMITGALLSTFILGVALGRIQAQKDSKTGRNYTCADILGPNPHRGYARVIPPGFAIHLADLRVWDDKGNLFCDAEGKPVR